MPATSGLKTSTPSPALEAYMADARGRGDAVPERLAAPVLAAGRDALELDVERRRTIALELFGAAGGGGMIGGQALDLEAEGRRLPAAELGEIHRRKTGALIAASCVIGGLAAGAAP